MAERQHGYWKTFGYSSTCSVCGNVIEGQDNYCMRCGSIMDGDPVTEFPKLSDLSPLAIFKCVDCGIERIISSGIKRMFCPNCGTYYEEVDDGQE